MGAENTAPAEEAADSGSGAEEAAQAAADKRNKETWKEQINARVVAGAVEYCGKECPWKDVSKATIDGLPSLDPLRTVILKQKAALGAVVDSWKKWGTIFHISRIDNSVPLTSPSAVKAGDLTGTGLLTNARMVGYWAAAVWWSDEATKAAEAELAPLLTAYEKAEKAAEFRIYGDLEVSPQEQLALRNYSAAVPGLHDYLSGGESRKNARAVSKFLEPLLASYFKVDLPQRKAPRKGKPGYRKGYNDLVRDQCEYLRRAEEKYTAEYRKTEDQSRRGQLSNLLRLGIGPLRESLEDQLKHKRKDGLDEPRRAMLDAKAVRDKNKKAKTRHRGKLKEALTNFEQVCLTKGFLG